MKTRSRGNYPLRGLCVGALSAASIGLLGLGLAQQSPAKLATADSPLSSSVRTALGGKTGGDNDSEPGSSDQAVTNTAIISPEFLNTIENNVYNNVFETYRLPYARYVFKRLASEEVLQQESSVDYDEKTKLTLEKQLRIINLTAEEQRRVLSAEELNHCGTFDFSDPESKPKLEFEVMAAIGNDPARYLDLLNIIFTDTVFATLRNLPSSDNPGLLLVNRPVTMYALFRSDPFFRSIVFSLPYKIDKIAELFVVDEEFVGLDLMGALPELQKESATPIPFTYVTACNRDFSYAQVNPDEKTVVPQNDELEIELSQVSSAKQLAQVIKQLKGEAKTPPTHELVVACIELLDPITDAKTFVLCSDLTLLDRLEEQKSFLEPADKLDGEAKIIGFHAIFVDPKYSQIMQNHMVKAFSMLEEFRVLDDKLTDKSALLVEEMRESVQNVADKERCCNIIRVLRSAMMEGFKRAAEFVNVYVE